MGRSTIGMGISTNGNFYKQIYGNLWEFYYCCFVLFNLPGLFCTIIIFFEKNPNLCPSTFCFFTNKYLCRMTFFCDDMEVCSPRFLPSLKLTAKAPENGWLE